MQTGVLFLQSLMLTGITSDAQMEILHITKKYPDVIGGDAIVVYSLKIRQLNMGNEVFILTSNCREVKKEKNIFKYGLKDRPSNLDRVTIRRLVSLVILSIDAFKFLKRIKPDIIHSHSADMGFFVSFAAKIYNIPILNTCHGISFADRRINFIKRVAEKFFLKNACFKKIVAVDLNGLQTLTKACLKNSVYIPNGVYLNKFTEISKRKNKKFKFLFVGRLEEQKGIIYLLLAASLLKGRNFEVNIVGDGSQTGYLNNAAKELGLSHSVNFLGELGEQKLQDEYIYSDAFVLPSIWEGVPLSILEAMAAGLPVIATDVGGITTICTNRVTGLIVKPKDPNALAQAMLEIMENKKLREKLAQGGRDLASRFTWENTATEYGKIYAEIVQQTKKQGVLSHT